MPFESPIQDQRTCQSTVLRAMILAVLAVIALAVAVWEFVHLRAMDRERPASSLERMQVTQPWGGLAAREGARFLETRWRLDAEASAAALWWQLHRYPMDPWRWLLMARIARQVPDHQPLLADHMRVAVSIQPGSREARWQSAQLAQAAGDAGLLVEHLRLWVDDQPHMSDRALFVAGRWIDDEGVLIDQVLPASDEHLERAMRFARQSRQPELAGAIWQRLDHPRSPTETVVAEYIRVLQAAGSIDELMTVWQDLDPGYRPGTVPAGHFGFDLDELPAFGWNLRTPEGVQFEPVRLDRSTRPHDAPPVQTDQRPRDISHALQITFDGSTNVDLRTPMLRFPVPEPGQYHLTGFWRADGLTTRSLPWIDVRTDTSTTRERVEPPGSDFGWTPFSIPVEIIEPGEIVRFQLFRLSTDAFDRYIEGRIWLAGLELSADPG